MNYSENKSFIFSSELLSWILLTVNSWQQIFNLYIGIWYPQTKFGLIICYQRWNRADITNFRKKKKKHQGRTYLLVLVTVFSKTRNCENRISALGLNVKTIWLCALNLGNWLEGRQYFSFITPLISWPKDMRIWLQGKKDK